MTALPDSLPRPRHFARLLPLHRIVLGALALAVAAFALAAVFSPHTDLSALFLHKQDRWLLAAAAVTVSLGCWRLGVRNKPLMLSRRAIGALAGGLLAACYLGHRFVLAGYDLSRDEQMANFDATVFAGGHLAQPLPAAWQPHAEAFNTLFMLPVAQPVAWVSSYLPVNAALRALVGLVVDPALTGPLLTALGLVFLWKCARLLWPAEREAAVVAALLYIGSGQILFTGMTAYAMPAHLTLNLLWLWLFLRDRRAADIGALAVAFAATGLHQPLFHPLFAAPFLVLLLRDRAWPRVALFAIGYGMTCAFWLAWPQLAQASVSGPHSVHEAAGIDYVTRLVQTIREGSDARFGDMAANLLRFAAWQHVLLLPLMVAGFALARHKRPTAALAACVVVPIYAMLVILPYQGHGFGYRYLHGVLGPAILLAAQGWRQLATREPRLRPLLMRTTAVGLLVILPLQAWMAHGLYAPFAALDAQLRASSADYAIIGSRDAPYSQDLAINRADLTNRPVRLLADHVGASLIQLICKPGATVALPGDAALVRVNRYFAVQPSGRADARAARLSPQLRAAGCRVERLD